MENVIFLYISLFILLLFAWKVFHRDILSPSILLILSFIGAVTLFIMSMERLQVRAYSFKTVFLIISAIIVFMCAQVICHKFYKKKVRPYQSFNNIEVKDFNHILLVVCVFTLVAMLIATVQFLYMRQMVGTETFAVIMFDFRDKSIVGDLPQNLFISIASRLLYVAQPILLLFLVYYYIVYKKPIKHKFILFLCFIFYAASVYIISGARGKIFSLIFQIFFGVVICFNYKDFKISIQTKTNMNIVRKMLIIFALVGIPIFYYVGIAGGKNYYSELSPFESVEDYLSFGLFRLNIFLEKGFESSRHFGQWSFPGIYSMLNKLGENYKDYDFFPFYYNYGNTSTIFGRWFVDFGYFGVYILSFINGILYGFIYYRMIFSNNKNKAFVASAIYMFLMENILMASYDDWTRTLITINGSLQLIIVILLSRYVSIKI